MNPDRIANPSRERGRAILGLRRNRGALEDGQFLPDESATVSEATFYGQV